MTPIMRTVRARALVAAVVLAAGALGAGSSQGVPAGAPRTASTAPGLAPMADDGCDLTASEPPAKNPNGARIRKIRERGSLVVGVDQNSYNWGFRNPQTGRIEGFDIDLVHALAKSILGDPDKVTLKTVPTARRIDAIKGGEVDMVVRTMSVTCDRKKDIAFSAPYFRVTQQLVVPRAAKATGFAEALRGKRACVADNSSSQAELKRDGRGTAEVRTVENQLDCLVLMQQGLVDATLTDNVLAAAQVAQDPTVRLVPETIAPGYMGVGMNQADTDLVAWVNQVLAERKANGDWRASYDRWLAPTMGASPDGYLP
ncbi:glutamate ABC transporter substrate-binding protein [Kitasatospora paracochleata]|uniref:Polar amino acid transport system substrate-binding protein n=1 Tax=Kitasatospora paracochleata TaxID=58354 RepID=A0ABT1IS55_9ACTN|nr:glutamate ABC transporter substrate-binding protein [Kitasatospora paracochleata]MCP2307956.1 polar amino acid transport system substrate-binding protein [Kitasatospora paracochleata]